MCVSFRSGLAWTLLAVLITTTFHEQEMTTQLTVSHANTNKSTQRELRDKTGKGYLILTQQTTNICTDEE